MSKSNKFEIDYSQIEESVTKLRKLLEACNIEYNIGIPTSAVDKGQTHLELNLLCENMKSASFELGELINNTILFLGQSSEMFKESDTIESNELKKPNSALV